MSCSKLHSTACLKPTHVFPFPWGLIPSSKNRLWSCSLSILKLTHLSLLINFYTPPPSWPEITIRRCKDSNTSCQWSDAPEWQTKTALYQVFAGQLWILFGSLLPTFIFVAVLTPFSTLPSTWIFAEYPTCNTCTLWQRKNPTQQNWSNFNSNFNLLSHGKKVS